MTVNILFSLGYSVHPDLAEELIVELQGVEENPMDFEDYWRFFSDIFADYPRSF